MIEIRTQYYPFSPCVAKARRKRESKNTKQETKRFSTFAVYRLRHSETKKSLIRESCLSGTCAKQPINNISFPTMFCNGRHRRESKNKKQKNKNQNGLAHSRFIVCVTPKQKKNIA